MISNLNKKMVYHNTKKLTLIEHRESDITTTKVDNNTHRKMLKMRHDNFIFDKFLSYILDRCKASDNKKTQYLLKKLMESWSGHGHPPMNMLLNYLHFILIHKKTEGAVDSISKQIALISTQMTKHEYYKKKLFLLKRSGYLFKTKIYIIYIEENDDKVFDKLCALTYEGIIVSDILLEGGSKDSSLEEILQDISDCWTKLLANADKEFYQVDLTLLHKHFIHVMFDTVNARAENLVRSGLFTKQNYPLHKH
ncbi:hypothetical protein RFI_31662 [Reticulomyxa filosa]|uniref:Uncharacterized protein n=1 Tax=Reticulomyxa filosa TaxID=46433 RepID=X6LVT0_RETFI|nr:hypothetical protein RFI_31662 [Reticulomyxa filosa]|eukprot:ETO05734.1 hypothetical protein RFI_31662 [Reticulomyxa filosa]